MKKILCILLSLLACVSLISCAHTSDDSIYGKHMQESESHTEAVSATQKENGDNISDKSENDINTASEDEPIIDEISTVLESYSEYCDYIEICGKALPEDFISYEKLSSIGAFDRLVFSISRDPSLYQYTLSAEDGFQIVVSVKHHGENDKNNSHEIITAQPIQLQNWPSSNMIYTDVYKSQNIIYNGIRYLYNSDGYLQGIIIWIDNTEILFYPHPVYVVEESEKSGHFVKMNFSDYNPKAENIITCLLSGNKENIDIASLLTDSSK